MILHTKEDIIVNYLNNYMDCCFIRDGKYLIVNRDSTTVSEINLRMEKLGFSLEDWLFSEDFDNNEKYENYWVIEISPYSLGKI